MILLLLRYERIGNGFDAVLRTDQHQRCATADNQTETSRRVLGQFVRLVRVSQVLYCVVQHQIKQRIVTLQYARRLAPSCELDADLLLQIL